MKPTFLKSILSFCIAIVISTTQFNASAQFESLSKEEAQSTLYMMAEQISQIKNSISIGNNTINDFSYNGSILNMSYLMNDEDVRFFTSDFITLQFHNLLQEDSSKKESFALISTLLRKADSNLRIEFCDPNGHKVEHILTPDDIDNIMTKSIEELGIDREQMSNYSIFYYNSLLKKNIDGVYILDAKAIKENGFVKLSMVTSFESEIINLLSPGDIKNMFLDILGSEPLIVTGFANQLKAFGYKGIILEYNNKQGASCSSKITVEDLLNPTSSYEQSYSPYSNKENYYSNNNSLEGLGTEQFNSYLANLSDAEKKQFTETFLQSMEIGAKEAIGTNGITNAHVFLSGDYASVLFSINGVADLSESELLSIKQNLVQKFRNDETMSTFSPIIQQATGIKGIKYIYKDEYSYKSATITVDWDEISGSNNSYNGYSNSYSDNSNEFDFSDANTDELREQFIQDLNNSFKSEVGTNGIADVWANLSGESLVMNFTFDSTIDFSDIGDLNEIKNELIQDMTATDDDLITCLGLYYLDIKNIKFVIQSESSRVKRSFTISIEDIVNGTFVPEEVQYNEI